MAASAESSSSVPTLGDVARAASVSKSLASLALRGDGGVSPDRRAAIVAAADSLGHPVSHYARRRAQGLPILLGALVTDLANPFHTEVLAGAEAAARRAGFPVLTLDGMHDGDWLSAQLDVLRGLDVSGLIVVSTWLEPDALAAAAAERPVVMIGPPPEGVGGVDSVATDDEDGIHLIVEHLVAMGHERIAFIAESRRRSTLRRQHGYVATVGRFFGHDHAVTATIDELEADPGRLRALIAQGVTALIGVTDMAAARVIEVAESIGARVPEDLAVTGFDNTAYSRLLRPRLTSADQPREAMGARAAELVIDRLAGRSEARHEVLRPSLVVRESTMTSTPATVGREAPVQVRSSR